MKKIFLLLILSLVGISVNVSAQNKSQDGVLKVQEIYGEGEVQTVPLVSDNQAEDSQLPVYDVNNQSDSENNNDGQLTIEENIEAEGVEEIDNVAQ